MPETPALTFVGARVVDPAAATDRVGNVAVEGERVAAVGADVVGEAIDATGLVLAPGLVDPHVHFRQPGAERSETVASGSAAAAMGGYTAVCAMANTQPAIHAPALVREVQELARATALCDVWQNGAITYDLAGERRTDVSGLAESGVRMLSDDGVPVASSAVMRDTLAEARQHGLVVCNHAQEPTLTVQAQANDGVHAAAAGLEGWPAVAEVLMVVRDLLLAEEQGAALHVPHVSTRGAVEAVRAAKARGVSVTAEATPHHFTLTDELVRRRDPVHKVNPPLRDQADVDAVRAGIADGTIDAIATDHAPHAAHLKTRPWEQACFGMIGLETSLGLTLTQLVQPGVVSLAQAIGALSTRPARAVGLEAHGGPIAPGRPANLVLFDPAQRWVVDTAKFASASRNCPVDGYELTGRVIHTMCHGRFVVRDGQLIENA